MDLHQTEKMGEVIVLQERLIAGQVAIPNKDSSDKNSSFKQITEQQPHKAASTNLGAIADTAAQKSSLVPAGQQHTFYHLEQKEASCHTVTSVFGLQKSRPVQCVQYNHCVLAFAQVYGNLALNIQHTLDQAPTLNLALNIRCTLIRVPALVNIKKKVYEEKRKKITSNQGDIVIKE